MLPIPFRLPLPKSIWISFSASHVGPENLRRTTRRIGLRFFLVGVAVGVKAATCGWSETAETLVASRATPCTLFYESDDMIFCNVELFHWTFTFLCFLSATHYEPFRHFAFLRDVVHTHQFVCGFVSYDTHTLVNRLI